MKAKRLHEKLEADAIPFDVSVQGRSGAALSGQYPARLEPIAVEPAETFISLRDARDFLRVEDGAKSANNGAQVVEAHSASLLKTLKDRVLAGWIRDMKAA